MNYYPSNIENSKIRNAITGIPYNCYVGTKDEYRFFRVIDSTGNYNINGKREGRNIGPNKLFFQNKEEYIKFYNKNNLK